MFTFLRIDQRSLSTFVLLINISTRLNQDTNVVHETLRSSLHQRALALVVHSINFRASVQKRLQDFGVIDGCYFRESRVAISVSKVYFRPGVQQIPSHISRNISIKHHERRLTAAIASIYVGLRPKQQLDHFSISVSNGMFKRG